MAFDEKGETICISDTDFTKSVERSSTCFAARAAKFADSKKRNNPMKNHFLIFLPQSNRTIIFIFPIICVLFLRSGVFLHSLLKSML